MFENMTVQDISSIVWLILSVSLIVIGIGVLIWKWNTIFQFIGSFKNVKAEIAGQKFEGERVVERVAELKPSKISTEQENLPKLKEKKVVDSRTPIAKNGSENEKSSIIDVYNLYNLDKFDEGKALFEKVQNEAETAIVREKNKLFNIYGLHLVGKIDGCNEFEKIDPNELHDDNRPYYFSILADLYNRTRQWNKSISAHKDYLKISSNELKNTESNIAIIEMLKQQGRLNDAEKFIKETLSTTNDNHSVSKYELELSDLLKELNRSNESLFHMIRAYSHNPTDENMIFDIAYRINNDSKLPVLSYQYYSILDSMKNNTQYGENNLGAVLGELDFPGMRLTYYKKAAKKGNDLAISNIANIYIEAGLYEEAAKILESGDQNNDRIIQSKHQMSSKIIDENSRYEKLTVLANKIEIFTGIISDNISLLTKTFTWKDHKIEGIARSFKELEIISSEFGTIAKWKESNRIITLSFQYQDMYAGKVSYNSRLENAEYYDSSIKLEEGFYYINDDKLNVIAFNQSESKEFQFKIIKK